MSKLSSIKDFLCLFPEKIEQLFESLDLSITGLDALKPMLEKRDLVAACDTLITYYSKNEPEILVNFPKITGVPQETSKPEEIIDNCFELNHVKDIVPSRADGSLDWHHLGPNQDKEWGWALNRHGCLNILLGAWQSSGNPKYASKANDLVQDWFISNPCPASGTDSAPWRHLETALRLVFVWCRVFYEFQTGDQFLPVTKLLMLVSILEQVQYVQRYHTPRGNILFMELTSLLVTSACFPEFKNAQPTKRDYSDRSAWVVDGTPVHDWIGSWVDYALPRIQAQLLDVQVYPDGVQKELTQHYHGVVARFAEFVKVASEAMHVRLNSSFVKRLHDMWGYIAWSLRPDGTGLLNNDSDLEDWRDRIRYYSDNYKEPSWLHVISNGRDGIAPRPGSMAGVSPTSLSVHFPWAGHVIMRDGWRSDSNWLFFDIGPYGTGHQHRDKLHVSVHANGHNWLVDAGRFWYKAGIWRDHYFKATRSHNTMMFDGMGQVPYEYEISQPLTRQFISNKEWDYAIGKYNRGYGLSWEEIMNISDFDTRVGPRVDKLEENGLLESGNALMLKEPLSHARAVVYIRSKYWFVFDSIDCAGDHEAEICWHFHPDCTVQYHPQIKAIEAINGEGTKFTIQLITDLSIEVELARGNEDPFPQGWWSREYNLKEPAVAVQCTIHVSEPAIISWALIPSNGSSNLPECKQLLSRIDGMVRLKVDDTTIDVSMDPDRPKCVVKKKKDEEEDAV